MATERNPRVEFETLEKLERHIASGLTLDRTVFQDLDLRNCGTVLLEASLRDTVFLGCRFDPKTLAHIHASGALHFPSLDNLPFRPYRGHLYTVGSLYDRYIPGNHASYPSTTDARIFRHYIDAGGPRPASIVETLARRLHDHAISDALEEATAGRTIVAIMGGHAMPRTAPGYRDVANLSRRLSSDGLLLASGGGPGAMEATNLGAAFAGLAEEDMQRAIELLSQTPLFEPVGNWLDAAFAVRSEFFDHPDEMAKNLGIPTWYFGHEPPNVFATDIAKYFANSVREEGLVSIARGGIIFAPGSVGTIQEVFQDVTQNHYVTLGHASPMVFLGKKFWTETKPIFPLLQHLASGRPYRDLLLVTDEIGEAADFICSFVDSSLL